MLITHITPSNQVISSLPSVYRSWLEYWEKNKGVKIDPHRFYECPGCCKLVQRKNLDGCHVQKYASADKNWYIVPLCDDCSQKKEFLDVNEQLLFAKPNEI